eukprot:2366377-Lingulodinium_polyedra.AAC.1
MARAVARALRFLDGVVLPGASARSGTLAGGVGAGPRRRTSAFRLWSQCSRSVAYPSAPPPKRPQAR